MESELKSVCVLGQGYIGLPTSAILASRGLRVFGVDKNPDVVATISEGKVHIVEADLDGLVHKVVSSGKLTAHGEPQKADAFIIAVPTPLLEDNIPDVGYVEQAGLAIAPLLEKGNLVMIESTVPVGMTERFALQLSELRPDLRFPQDSRDTGFDAVANIQIAYCPERVMPGRILTELIHNDRTVGGITPYCAERAASLYSVFLEADCIRTNARTAEIVKLSENTFRDVNIALANELSIICDRLGVDVWEMISLANRHPRVSILQPGPGVGGHCIAVDPWFLVHSAVEDAKLIRQAREVNNAKPEYVLNRLRALLDENANARVACLGLAFKANVDDLRESPALMITERLAEDYGERVIAVEPFISEIPDSLENTGALFMDALSAIEKADVIVVLTDHRQFQMIDVNKLGEKVVVDTRGLWRKS